MSKKITIDQLAIMVKNGFDNVDKKFNNVDKSFESIGKKLKEHDERFDETKEKLEEHDNRFDTLEKNQKQILEDLFKVEFLVAGLVKREEFLDLRSRVEKIEKKLATK